MEIKGEWGLNISTMNHAKKLRIAFLLKYFPNISQTFILNQIIYLIQQGHEIDIYADEADGKPLHSQLLKYDLLKRTKYTGLSDRKAERLKNAWAIFSRSRHKPMLLKTLNVFKYGTQALSFRILMKSARFLDAPKYDLIHAHFGNMGMDAVQLQELGLLPNVPIVVTFHGHDIKANRIEFYKKLYIPLFDKAKLITSNSNFTSNLLRAAGCPAEKILKLPVALDTTYFKRNPEIEKNKNQVNILFCGRFTAFKAPDLFVEIAHLLVNERGHQNLRFHMIGNGPLAQQVNDSIEHKQLKPYFSRYAMMTQDEIINLMSAMDIFLYPGINDLKTGRAENQGLVLQEAQAMELPVITSDAGGIAEGVIADETAFVVNEIDLAGFAGKVELLLSNPELGITMGKAGRKYVVRNFESAVLGRKLEKVYESVIAL